MGGKKERGGSSGANHVNLKQATNPGGFLFLWWGNALLSSVFPFLSRSLSGNLTSSAALPPTMCSPSLSIQLCCLHSP